MQVRVARGEPQRILVACPRFMYQAL
jgi:hypothetical protein